MEACIFCGITSGRAAAHVVLDAGPVVAFLDRSPLFPGHVLVATRVHRDTLLDVPAEEIWPLFAAVQRLARAVEVGMAADGSFVAVNTRISQSVPHVHVH